MRIRQAFERRRKKVKTHLEQQNLEINDSLAIDRTKLANERTLLAYMRTAMGMVLAGLTFIKLCGDDLFYRAVGLAFVPIGVGMAMFGFARFSRKKREVAARAQAYTPISKTHAKEGSSKPEEQMPVMGSKAEAQT